MYFITPRNSKTGLRFKQIEDRKDLAHNQVIIVAKKYGFEKWRREEMCAFGGISSVWFDNPPDVKLWKKLKYENEYFVRRNTKQGKSLANVISNLSTVSFNDLNQCVGFNGAPFKIIGSAFNNPNYFGFILPDDWCANIPTDCEKVSKSKYDELFPIKIRITHNSHENPN